MTRDELLALPAVVDLVTAGRAWDLGRTQSYALARSGEFPCPVQRVGRHYRVVTEHLLGSLGLATRPGPDTATQKVSEAGLHQPGHATATATHGGPREHRHRQDATGAHLRPAS